MYTLSCPEPLPHEDYPGTRRIIRHPRNGVNCTAARRQLRRGWDSPIIALTFGVHGGPERGTSVRTFLGLAVIAVGIVNICLQHRWHRVLGVIAIAVGLILCVLVWIR
jgi:hypothetical protein